MGQYLSPPVPSDYQTKCAIIVYPHDDGAFYLQALKGQLSKLALRWIWEGDDDKQREIADIWLAHDLMTDEVFFRLDCDDVPFIIGDEDVNINVNCNCGCGGTGGEPTTIICYDSDGNPIVTPQPPVEPYQPTPDGGDWPQEPAEDLPPSGFEDWTEFDSEACAASNGLWQAAYAWVTIAEGGVDLIASVAAALAIFAAQALAELLAVIGGASLIKMGEALVRIILSEQASDILNEAKQWLEDNKTEIVCTIFRLRYDIPTMQLELVRMLFAHVDSILTLNDEEQAALREWARTIFPLNLLISYFFEYQRYISASSPVDCSTCDSGNALIDFDASDKGDLSAFLEQYSTHSSIRASGYVDRTGAQGAIWAWIAPVDSIEDMFPGVDVHGLEFVVNKLQTTVPNGPQFKCRGIAIGFPSPGQSILVHDGTLPTLGYDVVVSGSPTNNAWGPAMNVGEISSGLVSTDGDDADEPAGDVVIDIRDVYWLDQNGDRVT